MTNVVDAILQRVSNPKLTQPAPSREEVEVMLQCAVRAPDHGRLQPWRFIVLEHEGLSALGEAFVSTQPDASEARISKLRAMPHRAPMIIVTVAAVDPGHPKVPVWEQEVAAGIATQHIQLVAHNYGYGAMWRTGAMAEAPAVKRHLGLTEDERIIAFLYLGSAEGEPRVVKAASIAGRVEFRD